MIRAKHLSRLLQVRDSAHLPWFDILAVFPVSFPTKFNHEATSRSKTSGENAPSLLRSEREVVLRIASRRSVFVEPGAADTAVRVHYADRPCGAFR